MRMKILVGGPAGEYGSWVDGAAVEEGVDPRVRGYVGNYETAELNSTKLIRKQDFIILYHVFVFRTDQKTNMAFGASNWLRHLRLLM